MRKAMGDGTKQVRVDNWGIFFLQRLQMFFSRTDYCDMTLQFEGNVQLKVHRLVMNACTEYFQFLEQTCTLEENVIMMPTDLQADVIVPIVNFMYTGMLEFHLSIFDKLYKTAQVMNITILTKLLDAQKIPVSKSLKKKRAESPQSQSYIPQAKRPLVRPAPHSDLPATLPGRKLPVWKRKSAPAPSHTSTPTHSHLPFAESKWASPVDPLTLPDNAPKPTRFEWPDDDPPPLNPLDSTFEEVSLTSRPLLTQEEELRATPVFDDLRHIPNAQRVTVASKKQSSPTFDMEEVKNYVKEQKIRVGLEEENADDVDVVVDVGQKRKAIDSKSKPKKVRFEEEDKATTISVTTEGKGVSDLNHEKIVAEILKKYPQLVKKNKNIRLKIMAKNKGAEPKGEAPVSRSPKMKVTDIQKIESPKPAKPESGAPWRCLRCSSSTETVEFALFYLYRKHMTDVHNEKFDSNLCKYCGHKCTKPNLLMYHHYTKHGMKPPPNYQFPKCENCPFIALNESILNKHKSRHSKDEMQCVECKLAFTSQMTLTSHVQITGHTGRATKPNYDCQYCTKKMVSVQNLFEHVRLQHKNEGLRDGIVSIDEVDDLEEFDDDVIKDEYILPEIIPEDDPQTSKKVNILSNVKVQERQETAPHPHLSLEPSSEAEALNNVASGIATSLGLVDIVVLNDNQQIFLQSNQQNFNDQSEQGEFILPELGGRETYGQGQNEVIAQSMLSSGDIGSTDELVMVLTDHDYGDNQEEINSDNSKIVVLYSHPVDGQQEQYITSQGNLMVNSQGMLEIRNGATITSTANQVVLNPPETQIESIEMIQREIQSQQEAKQESSLSTEENQSQAKENALITRDPLIESLTQGQQLELTSPLVPTEETEKEDKEKEESDNEETVTTSEEEAKSEESGKEKTEEIEEKSEEKNEEKQEAEVIEETETSQQHEETENKDEEEKTDEINEEKGELEEAKNEDKKQNESGEEEKQNEEAEENQNGGEKQKEQEEGIEKEQEEEEEEKHEEEDEEEAEKHDEEEEEKQNEENEEAKKTPPHPETEKEEEKEEASDKTEEEGETVEEEEEEKAQPEQESSRSESSASINEDSRSCQEERQENETTKIAILEDWDDTDSQQSDQKEKKKSGETVDKLMDDWDDDEDDENRKEADG